MLTRTIAKTVLAAALLPALISCGGGSSGDTQDDGPAPTGGALANVWFDDSESYHPLDKLKPDGSFYTGSEADFGPVNPAYAAHTNTQSRWAIDASATPPEGKTLTYSMRVERQSATDAAVKWLQSNLQLNADTGLITQSCSGYPNCYDNTTAKDEDFLVTVVAKPVGGGGSLERNFLLRVRAN